MTTDVTPVESSGLGNLSGGSTVNNAASDFDNFINALEAPEEEEVVEETVEEEEEIDEEEEATEEDEEEASDEEVEGASDEQEEEYYVVSIDDEDYEVTQDELLAGYKRHQDHIKSQDEVKNKLQEYDGKMAEAVEKAEKLEALLAHVETQDNDLLKEYEGMNWEALRAKDPNGYARERLAYIELKDQVDARKSLRSELFEGISAEKDRKREDFKEQEQKRVEAEFGDIENNPEFLGRIKEQIKTMDFNEADQDLLDHAVVIRLLDKAAKYDELQGKQTAVREKIRKVVPKTLKSKAKTTNQESQAKRSKDLKQAVDKYKSTGNLRDASAMFEQFL
jgi:hypothetical protein